jgi:hypothetical protein
MQGSRHAVQKYVTAVHITSKQGATPAGRLAATLGQPMQVAAGAALAFTTHISKLGDGALQVVVHGVYIVARRWEGVNQALWARGIPAQGRQASTRQRRHEKQNDAHPALTGARHPFLATLELPTCCTASLRVAEAKFPTGSAATCLRTTQLFPVSVSGSMTL